MRKGGKVWGRSFFGWIFFITKCSFSFFFLLRFWPISSTLLVCLSSAAKPAWRGKIGEKTQMNFPSKKFKEMKKSK